MTETDAGLKLYYTISEVAAELNVNASLLRFWEKEFEELHPKKNRKGNRLYTAADLQLLRLIHHLVKDRGFTLEGARNKIREKRSELEDKADLIQTLRQVKSMLIELKEAI